MREELWIINRNIHECFKYFRASRDKIIYPSYTYFIKGPFRFMALRLTESFCSTKRRIDVNEGEGNIRGVRRSDSESASQSISQRYSVEQKVQ